MKINDFVSYPGHGLGQITEVKVMHGLNFFLIQILDSGLKIMIPETSGHLVRPLMTRAEAKLCALYIRESGEYMPDKTPSNNWKRRHDLYLAKLNSNNPVRIAEVIAELNTRKFDGEDLSFGERKMLDAAHALIDKEIGMVLK